ncbi:MAG: hypothetical protein MJE12_18605, partial [Alphaproteobacteria bacterium]|nr:hypothetical protein [Alphaproteobacteria bacterium]
QEKDIAFNGSSALAHEHISYTYQYLMASRDNQRLATRLGVRAERHKPPNMRSLRSAVLTSRRG